MSDGSGRRAHPNEIDALSVSSADSTLIPVIADVLGFDAERVPAMVDAQARRHADRLDAADVLPARRVGAALRTFP